MQVRADDGVDGVRLRDHAHGHGVDEHLVPLDVWKVGRDLRGDFVPQHEAVAHRIALRYDGEEFPRPVPRRSEGEAHDALDGHACEDGDFRCCFPGLFEVRAPTLPCVFAFAVFADEEPVDGLGGAGGRAQVGSCAGEGPDWADVGVEL